MTVRVEASDPSALDSAASLAARLRTLIKEVVGVTVDVEVLAPRALERSLGKAKRIDDQR
jgi:phenylacetate-CoA ligase